MTQLIHLDHVGGGRGGTGVGEGDGDFLCPTRRPAEPPGLSPPHETG